MWHKNCKYNQRTTDYASKDRNLFQLKTLCVFLIVAVAALGASKKSYAIIVHDNLGPGDTYNIIGHTILGSGALAQAFAFSPTASGFFSQLTIGLGNTTGSPASMQVVLHADGAGTPGTILETLTFDVAANTFFINNGTTTVSAAGTSFLDSANTYWLSATSITSAVVPWMYNNAGAIGTRAQTTSGLSGPWTIHAPSNEGAFRVEVDTAPPAVPEASSILIFAAGLAALGLIRRSRNST